MDPSNSSTNSVFERFIVMGVDTRQKEITYENIVSNEFSIDFIDVIPYFPSDTPFPPYMEGMKEVPYLPPASYGLKIYDQKLNVLNDSDPLDTFRHEAQFCKEYAKINPIHQKDLLYHFVTTDGDSTKRYCTALVFHEKFYLMNDNRYQKKRAMSKCMPKIPMVDILKNPLILDEDTDTIYIPKVICLVSRGPFFYAQRQFLHFYYHNIIMGKLFGQKRRTLPIYSSLLNDFNSLIIESGLKTAEKLWDDNYYTSFASKIDQDQSAAEKAILYKVKETHLSEFYLSYIFSMLRIPDNQNLSYGVYRWATEGQDKSGENMIFKFASYARETISPANFSFGPLLKRSLDQTNFLKIIKNVLLERFVIIFSSSPGEIACLTEAIFRLIAPLVHITYYVPFATLHHDWLLDAPGSSAVIGYSKAHKQHIMEKISEGDRSGKVLVDLDENTVEECGVINLQLPVKPKSYVIRELTKLEQEFKQSKQKNTQWEKTVMEIQRVFFNFMVWIINDFMRFFRESASELSERLIEQQKQQQQQEGGQSRRQLFEIDEIFDKEAYLRIFPLEDQAFMREIIYNTMMFSYFVGQTYEMIYLKQIQRKSIQEFLDAIDLIKSEIKPSSGTSIEPKIYFELDHEKTIAPLIAEQDKFIMEVMQQQEQKLSIYPQLIKWIQYLKFHNLESFEGKKKKKEHQSFWHRFWSSNILHFVSEDQRQHNRNFLNQNVTLYKTLDQRMFVDLANLFSKNVFQSKKPSPFAFLMRPEVRNIDIAMITNEDKNSQSGDEKDSMMHSTRLRLNRSNTPNSQMSNPRHEYHQIQMPRISQPINDRTPVAAAGATGERSSRRHNTNFSDRFSFK